MERTLAVVTDVQDLADLLAGASVDQVQLVSAGGQMQVVIELTRALLERQEIVQRGLFRRLKTPWTKCELRLSRITAATVKRLVDLAPNQTPVVVCDAVGAGYRITVHTPDGLELLLTADRLAGTFADVGHVIETP